MSPRQLDEWPKEKDHEFTTKVVKETPRGMEVSNKSFFISVYCKCRTTAIGVAWSDSQVEEIQREHLIMTGVIDE